MKTKYILLFLLFLVFGNEIFAQSNCFDDAPCSSGVFRLYYYDGDGDGIGAGDGVCWCTSDVPSNYSSRRGDCDDNNPNIGGPRTWYQDSDGDGYGNAIGINACTAPSGYVDNNDDCDDNDPNIGTGSIWYRDTDNDGFGDPNNTQNSCTQPSGYVSNDDDCNDSDATTSQLTFYADTDGDGYGDTNKTILACTAPNGYVNDISDCNDSNELINPATVWYPDNDGDGYPHVTQGSGIAQCQRPTGYTLYGVTSGSDCNDNDVSIHPDTVWYRDTDGDGLGDPNDTKVQCTQPSGYVLDRELEDPMSESPLPDLTGLDVQDMNMTYMVEPYQQVTTVGQLNALTDNNKMQSKTYYDGMGRPVQEVAMHAGGISYEGYTGNDIVNYIEYDRFGRSNKQYSPYGRTDGTATGAFSPDAKNKLMDFYAQGTLQNSYMQTGNPFSETVFDRSPRNRAIRQSSPGDNWSIDSNNELITDYNFNTGNEVRHFGVTLDTDLNPTLETLGHYPENELVKTIVKDENWTSGLDHTVEEFVDKDGQTVLKRTYVNGETLSTYYVYDDYNNLIFILPPKAAPDTATITVETIEKLCFQYRYDALRRQVEMRNPGVDGWEKVVYDHEDRPILVQDANMQNDGQWLFTKYDKFGRVVYTGLYSSTSSREQLQQLADDWVQVNNKPNNEIRTSPVSTQVGDAALNYSINTFPDTGLNVLTVNYYDDYATGTPYTPTIPTQVLGQPVTTNTKGLATVSWTRVLKDAPNWNRIFTFYDERAQPIRLHTINYQGGHTIVDTELDFRGKVVKTVSEHKKDANGQLVSIEDRYAYDHMERLRKQEQTVYDGGTDSDRFTDRIVSGFVYDALGQLSTKYVEPQSDGFGWHRGIDTSNNTIENGTFSGPVITVEHDFDLTTAGHYDISYDFTEDTSNVAYTMVLIVLKNGSMLHRKQVSVSEMANGHVFVAASAGQYQVQLTFGTPNGTYVPNSRFSGGQITMVRDTSIPVPNQTLALANVAALQTVNYKYNARGSMTDINDTNQLGADLFAYKINYDQPTLAGATPMFNGAIAETQWKTQNDNVLRGYAYQYDALSRLVGATNSHNSDYDLNTVAYDKNGNIEQLNRSLFGGGAHNFSYQYGAGNRLLALSGSKTSVYTYDANGNMLSDSGKGIDNIDYNHLDLPKKVFFDNGATIAYEYDAVGTKLKKTFVQSGTSTVTEYWNGFQYEQGQLQFFSQPEGYIAVDQNTEGLTFGYVYNYTDHLGNVRLSYSDLDSDGNIAVTEIVRENNYYPFGMLHQGYNNALHDYGSRYRYGFNGKELQEENSIAWLDFGSRNYDAELGRWMNLDPQAGRYHSLSPYAAMGNNPITFVDPNGEELITSLIIGAGAGAIIGGTSVAIANPRADFGDILGGAAIGAFSGAVTAGIGQAFSGTAGVLAGSGWQPFAQAGAHALFQGGLAVAQGGNFGQGAATAFASSLIGGATASGGPVAQATMGAFTGGFTSLLTGGSFEQGFATGLTVSGLNHALHNIANSSDRYELLKDGRIKRIRGNGKGRGILVFGNDKIVTDASILSDLENNAIWQKVSGAWVEGHYAISDKITTTFKLYEWIGARSPVEWSYADANTSFGSKAMIGTLHQGSAGLTPYPNAGGFGNFTINRFSHTHYGTGWDDFRFSPQDANYARRLGASNPNAKFDVYAPLINMERYNNHVKNRPGYKTINYEPSKFITIPH